jgi:hypothetical protein
MGKICFSLWSSNMTMENPPQMEVSMGIAKFENRRVNDVGVCTLFSDKSI